MKVKVFHAAFESKSVHVATVEAPEEEHENACEYAYRCTQNIDDCWSKSGNAAVSVEVPVGKLGHRSTSVGDYCEVAGQLYQCSGIGFRPVDRIECVKHLDCVFAGF